MELLPCPMCAGPATSQKTATDAAVWCICCGVKVVRQNYLVNMDAMPRAIAAWNRRAPTAPKENDDE